MVGDRLVIGRVDRIELTKNLVRGFLAFDQLLERHPEHRGRVVFVAGAYPSRTGVPAYADYRAEVHRVVDEVNDRWGTGRLDADPARRGGRPPALGGRCSAAPTCCS